LNLEEISKILKAELIGNSKLIIDSISSINNIKDRTIVLISNPKLLEINHDLEVVYLVDKKNRKLLPKKGNYILVENPNLAFAKLTKIFNVKGFSNLKKIADSYSLLNVSSAADIFIGENVSFGKNCFLGVNVTIEDNVVIGDNVYLANNVIIGRNCTIGNDVIIDSGTIIGSEGFGNVRDNGSKWHHVVHSGSVEIMNNVSIGANCCIDRGTLDKTIISNGVIIDNLVHIAHNVHIGEDSAIAAKVGIAGSCIIGKRNMIGGMVGIIDHIKTADDVIISATSTVNKDLKEPGIYTGIMPISKHALWKRIALWITKLDKIAQFLKLKKEI